MKRNLIGIKLPDSNEMGLKFLKHMIPLQSTKKLFGIVGMTEKDNSKESEEILEMANNELKKRGLI